MNAKSIFFDRPQQELIPTPTMKIRGGDLDLDHADEPGIGLAHAEDALLGRGERDDHHIVLVLAPAGLALPGEQADHREGHPGHPRHRSSDSQVRVEQARGKIFL